MIPTSSRSPGKPSDLAKAKIVNLPENDKLIREITSKAQIIVVSWGNIGLKSGRGQEVEGVLEEICDPNKVFCFGKKMNGAPSHPLYKPMNAELIPFFDMPKQ